MTHQTHAFHIVNPRPWPLTGALSAPHRTSGLVIWFHLNSTFLLSLGLLTNILTMYQWWQDIIQKSFITCIYHILTSPTKHTEKSSPYKCGFDTAGSACLPFFIKFFTVSIMVLLFDLEMIFLPLPWASQTNNLMTILIIVLLLISLLAISLAYKWTQKGLEWTKYGN